MRPTLSVDRFFLSWVLAPFQDGSEQIGKKIQGKVYSSLESKLNKRVKTSTGKVKQKVNQSGDSGSITFPSFQHTSGCLPKRPQVSQLHPRARWQVSDFCKVPNVEQVTLLTAKVAVSAFLCLLAVMLEQVLLAAEAADLVNGASDSDKSPRSLESSSLKSNSELALQLGTCPKARQQL